MTWLFGQLWVLMLLAFVLGSLVTYVVERLLLPSVDEVEAEFGEKRAG